MAKFVEINNIFINPELVEEVFSASSNPYVTDNPDHVVLTYSSGEMRHFYIDDFKDVGITTVQELFIYVMNVLEGRG